MCRFFKLNLMEHTLVGPDIIEILDSIPALIHLLRRWLVRVRAWRRELRQTTRRHRRAAWADLRRHRRREGETLRMLKEDQLACCLRRAALLRAERIRMLRQDKPWTPCGSEAAA